MLRKFRNKLEYVQCLSHRGSLYLVMVSSQSSLTAVFAVYLWSHSADSNSIKVFVRVRPLTHGTGLTTDGDQRLCLTVTSPNTIRLLSKPEPRTFTYDHVADVDTSQVHILLSKLPLKKLSLRTKCDVILSSIWMFFCRMLYSPVWPRILLSLAWMDIMEPYLLSKIYFFSMLMYYKDQEY